MKNLTARRNDLFGYDLFDSFDSLFRPLYSGIESDFAMKTDIKETDKDYVLEMELAGYKKDELELKLDNGYLTISGKKESNSEDKKESYIRKERTYGSVTRSFYVGANLKEEDVAASFENGMLTLTFPKEAPEKVEEKKTILIK